MYEVKLSWENGRKETKSFDDYNDMISYLADNLDAGFRVWKDGEQINEADVARDVELVS
jgi:serine protease inhibitor ecotin